LRQRWILVVGSVVVAVERRSATGGEQQQDRGDVAHGFTVGVAVAMPRTAASRGRRSETRRHHSRRAPLGQLRVVPAGLHTKPPTRWQPASPAASAVAGRYATGRMSTSLPSTRIAAYFSAHAFASSSEGTSMIEYPATSSFDSVNGPSTHSRFLP